MKWLAQKTTLVKLQFDFRIWLIEYVSINQGQGKNNQENAETLNKKGAAKCNH